MVANAGIIELTFKANDVTVSGEFAGFRDDAYVIETPTGLLYVPVVLVTCAGADCIDLLVN